MFVKKKLGKLQD
jgi:hypothetical protein